MLHHHTPTPLFPTVNHIYNAHGKRETIDSLRASNAVVWDKALSNEWGRLATGNIHGVIATDTIEFIHRSDVPPPNNAITYASFVCDHRPLKSEPWRVRIVVGGDCLPYSQETGSPAASILETKLIINSTISDAKNGARFMSLDLKDFFLTTAMQEPEYMKVHISSY